MKHIPVGDGLTALVDDEDYELVSKYSWHINNGYARAWTPSINRKRKKVYMHSLIANTPKGMYTDHRNRNRLDNTRTNLRAVTPAQNSRNSGPRRTKKGVFKGAHRQGNRWTVTINVNAKNVYVGSFLNEEAAARAYDEKARMLFGEYAYLNFPLAA